MASIANIISVIKKSLIILDLRRVMNVLYFLYKDVYFEK